MLLLLPLTIVGTAAAASDPFATWFQGLEIRDGLTLTLPPGVHHVRADGLQRRHLHLSNNDDGEKVILFDLSGRENITIEGNGAELVMHGHVIPFFMRKAKNIVIRNLTIDWANPFYAQGTVTDTGADWFTVCFESEYKVEVRDGHLVAINPDLSQPIQFHNLNFIDPQRGEQAFRSKDEYYALKQGNFRATNLGNGLVHLQSRHFRNRPHVGHVAVFQYDGRTAPAIAVQHSTSIRIEHVTQYHAAAIANLFEGSRDITIAHMRMTRRGNRWFSAQHDATHFVECSGDITIENSLFEFQFDDGTNIHGIYRTIERLVPDNGIRLRLMHHQHLGADTLQPGDVIALLSRDELAVVHQAAVRRVEWISPQLMDVYCDGPLPDLDLAELVVMNYITDVRVTIAGNRFLNNRARSLLIKSFGKIRIHDNYFHAPGPAILISAGLSNWYESGPVDDVAIFNNVFDQCNFGDWGEGVIVVAAALAKPASEYPVMRNIRIHGNRFTQIRQPLLKANNVANLEFYDNTILRGTDYPFHASPVGDFQFGPGVTTGTWQVAPTNE
jgi:pectate lyase